MSAAAAPDPSLCVDARRIAADPDADELSRRRAEQHLARCATCAPVVMRSHPSLAALDAQLGRLEEGQGPFEPLATLVGPGDDSAEVDDELSERVLSRLSRHRPQAGPRLRSAVGVLGLLQLVLSLPWLFGANPWTMLGEPSEAHLTRDGALGVAAAVAGIVTAWRPRYAFSMLALCAAIVGMQVLGGAVDEHSDIVGGGFEAVHVLTIGIVVLVVVIALRRERPHGPRR